MRKWRDLTLYRQRWVAFWGYAAITLAIIVRSLWKGQEFETMLAIIAAANMGGFYILAIHTDPDPPC